jgi:hypothetical protein
MAVWKVVRRLAGAPMLACYLVGPGEDADRDGVGDWFEDILAAVPGMAIAATGEAPGAGDLAGARRALGATEATPLVLAGYSAGCQPVRSHLQAGVRPRGVLAIDGTHASIPPAPAQLAVWRDAAARARAGEHVLVTTCTLQRYTSRLRPPHVPFLPTADVLANVLELPELDALRPLSKPLAQYPGDPLLERHEGDLHFYAFGGTDVDKAAHAAQGRHVLPMMLRRHVAPLFPELTPPWRDPTVSLGERGVRWCEQELADGVRETPLGSNWSPRIEWYAEPAYRRETGQLLKLKSLAWCAVAQCAAQRECLLAGEAGAHGYYASGAELREGAKNVGLWRPGGSSYVPRRGDLLVLLRVGAGSDTAKDAWERHVVRVTRNDGGNLATIGGNEANAWGRQSVRWDDARVEGAIEYPTG